MLPDINDPTVDFELPYEDFSFQVDPETDVRATVIEKIGVEISAMSQTIGRAMVEVDASASDIIAHRAVWGNKAGVIPTLTKNGTGDFTLTWDSSYDDLNPTASKRVSHSPNFQLAGGTINDLVAGCIAVGFTANTVRVKTFTHAGAAADYDFTVWAA